ncbi:MAG: hypothetical protein H6Q74_1850 [Firmicutes bacterium]|nr:hypothetical protein [Bacillota bacterium]
MTIEEILEEMETLLEESGKVPLTQKRLVDQDSLYRLIDAIHDNLPKEFNEATNIINERQRIIDEAHREAQSIVEQAKSYIIKLTDENAITRQAQDQANELVQQARENARILQNDSVAYANEVFSYIEANLTKALEVVKDGQSKMQPNKPEQ